MTRPTWETLRRVGTERRRQNVMVADGTVPFDCTDPKLNPMTKLAVLTEELGEVARAVLDEEPLEDLRGELIQVAAVAVAWAEGIPCDD